MRLAKTVISLAACLSPLASATAMPWRQASNAACGCPVSASALPSRYGELQLRVVRVTALQVLAAEGKTQQRAVARRADEFVQIGDDG